MFHLHWNQNETVIINRQQTPTKWHTGRLNFDKSIFDLGVDMCEILSYDTTDLAHCQLNAIYVCVGRYAFEGNGNGNL